MGGIDKEYFPLEEIESRWDLPWRDLVYLAENGLLKVSVRLYGVRIELGAYEEVDHDRWCNVPEDRVSFQGLQDILARDVYRLFHEGDIRVEQFDAPGDRYCHVLDPEAGVVVTKEELVVRREERDRVEAKHGLGGVQRATESVFEQKNDFGNVILGERTYTLGPIQARVVGILYDAATTGSPWRHGQKVLAEAGSRCTRVSDLFKAQSGWRKLIQSDKRGKYRLNIKFS
jgi:hypothetical protein